MARSRLSELRDRQFNISLTATEYDSILRRATALGLRPVQLGRALLFDTKTVVTGVREKTPNSALRLEISRLGNLLNQLVRHLHRTGDPLPADLEPLLRDIRRLLAQGEAG